MPRIIGYAYNAAAYCPNCTRDYVEDKRGIPDNTENLDQHGIPLGVTDREGNLITPIFSTDEGEHGECDGCGDPIY